MPLVPVEGSQHQAKGPHHLVCSRCVWATQAELESLAGCDPLAGCEGEWSLVRIRNDITALLIEGDIANSIVWLEDDIRFDVVGPAETFSADEAIEVANQV